jgi:two-component system, NtrC family, sensor histidine kinase HydH
LPTLSGRYRTIWPIFVISLGLLLLCTLLAVSLFQQQQQVALQLNETIRAHREVDELEETLADLIGLIEDRVEAVVFLHERIVEHFADLDRYTASIEEIQALDQLKVAFREYRQQFQSLPPKDSEAHSPAIESLLKYLKETLLPRSQELRSLHDLRLENSATGNRRVLRELALGMIVIGLLGSVAGLLVGLGVRRSINRSVQRLQFHLQDAAGKLGEEFPAIVVTGEQNLDQLDDQMRHLVGRVESVVQKLQQREREVLRAEQLAAVGQLAAGVAHEIRNPLTSIKMLIQVGREAVNGEGLLPEDLVVIEREIRRMEKSLNTFLDFARPPKLERHEIELVSIIHRMLDLLRGRAEKQEVRVRFEHPRPPVNFHGDGEQLHQVLVNLALNALDAMPGGGELFIQLRMEGKEAIEIEFFDSGPGFPAEQLQRLFEPFASAKQTGLGLGLVICKRIIEDHGGRVFVTNQPMGGAAVTLHLPTVRPGSKPNYQAIREN